MDESSRLSAIEDIKVVKARYFRGVDTHDEHLLRRVFTADVVLDYRGSMVDPVTGINHSPEATEHLLQGREAALAALTAPWDRIRSVHHGCGPEITLSSETTADAIWAMVDRVQFAEGNLAEVVGYGHYFETYDRGADGWKIKTLRLARLRLDFTLRPGSP